MRSENSGRKSDCKGGQVVEQKRRRPVKGENPDVLDIALQFVEGRGCVIHVRDSSIRCVKSKQLGIGKLKVLVTPREHDRYSITVGVEMSIRTEVPSDRDEKCRSCSSWAVYLLGW